MNGSEFQTEPLPSLLLLLDSLVKAKTRMLMFKTVKLNDALRIKPLLVTLARN